MGSPRRSGQYLVVAVAVANTLTAARAGAAPASTPAPVKRPVHASVARRGSAPPAALRLSAARAAAVQTLAVATAQVVGLSCVRVADAVQVDIRTSSRLIPRPNHLPAATPGGNSRFYVDLPGARAAGVAAPAPPKDAAGKQLVRAVRVAQFSQTPPVTRVALELAPGAAAEVLPASPISKVGETQVVRIRVREDGDADAAEAPVRIAKKGLVVALDPGHGGLDPGAVNAGLGLQEKNVTLDIAHRVRALLEKAGVTVVMSRAADQRLPPSQRQVWAEGLRADLLVSIHCDAVEGRDDHSGTTTYYHAGSTDGRELAGEIQRALIRATGAPDLGVRPDTSRYELGFYLLRSTRPPAVLVETGYITHAETARRFKDPAYCQRVARALAAGIQEYVKETK